MRRSQFILGRREVRDRLSKNGSVTVAAVQCKSGSTDSWIMFMETTKTGKQKFPVLYRINIRLKQ